MDIVPDNIRAVAAIFAATEFEQMRLFDVVDRIVELFLNGLLPIGYDSAGRALDQYLRSRDDRLTSAERRALYTRVLGLAGGDVAAGVQANSEFDDLFLRFVTSVAEFDRQRSVTPVPGGGTSLVEATEAVRHAGRDLASNVSLYGYGYAHFAARRLNQQIQEVLAILKQPPILKAYGASNPWHVIEIVTARDLGGKVDVQRYRTLAEKGTNILTPIARYSVAWRGDTGRPLFTDAASGRRKGPDIPDRGRDELIIAVLHWLAAKQPA